jgi:uncharacterized linocin/CFP29 family protein
MNNLHRELAPISSAAWSEIEEEARRTFRELAAARRVVDVVVAGDAALSAPGTWRTSRAPRTGCGRGCARPSGSSTCACRSR